MTYPHAFRFAFNGGYHPEALRAFEFQKAAAESFGQKWSEKHAAAFRELQQAYILTALGVIQHQRTAWPLAVGTGKTQSIVAFCRVQSESRNPKSIMVCMERVAQMRDLYADLLNAGVPSDMVAVHHSKSTKDIEAEGLPESTPLDDVDRYPFLLVTHSMMLRGERNIEAVNCYRGCARSLTVWDESLIKSQGYHFDLAGMESAVAVLEVAIRDTEGGLKVDAGAAHEALSVYLQGLRREFEAYFGDADLVAGSHIKKATGEESATKYTAGLMPAADWPDGAITRYEAAVNAVMRRGKSRGATEGLRKLLMELFDYTLRPVRVIPYRERTRRAGVIRYESRIPQSLRRLIVLDASHTIRLLTSKHDTQLHTTPVDCAIKSFDRVDVSCIQHGAGKDALATALRSRESVVMKELIERVRKIPDDEAALFVTFKAEQKDRGRGMINYVSLAKAALRRAGIDTDAKLPDGRDRFAFITWGQHLGVCGFSYYRHLFAVGVTRRHSLDLASAIAGQQDDLNTRFAADLEEVTRVELSEMFHNLMQFAGRGSCRNTVDGNAESMSLTVLCNDVFPAELWQAAMPGVVVTEARSKHATKYKRASATAVAIVAAFGKVRPDDDYVSARTIKVLADLGDMRPDTFSGALAKVRKQGIEGWVYQKERQGFTRCPFPDTLAA